MDGDEDVLLLLGGNLGDTGLLFDRAERLIEERVGGILSRSRDHRTEPWGFDDHRLFLNRAILVRTSMAPLPVLEVLLVIERDLGRTRDTSERYGARTIDIDILLMGDRIIEHEQLHVPHPRMALRAFALAPAADIAPNQFHPVQQRTVLQLLNDLSGRN